MDFYTLDDLCIHIFKNRNQSKPTISSVSKSLNQSGQSFRDVHVYDGKLTLPSIQILKFSNLEKATMHSKIVSILNDQRAKIMATKLLSETNDFDGANNFNTSDIFATVLSRRMTLDILQLLEEQLIDILMLGQCPQGRTTRMLQILELTIA